MSGGVLIGVSSLGWETVGYQNQPPIVRLTNTTAYPSIGSLILVETENEVQRSIEPEEANDESCD